MGLSLSSLGLGTYLGDEDAATDAGYPDNADLVIDDAGRPSLKQ